MMFSLAIRSSLQSKYEMNFPLPPGTTHDRVNQFTVENGHLFWRPLDGEEWTEVSLPGNRKAFQVKADWENLMVLDTEGDVHYAKSVSGTGTLMQEVKWQKGIWDLPVISEIYNRIVKEPNFVVANGESWACSYLEDGAFYVDGAGQKHALGDDGIGPTTTAFVADHVNRCFRFYDPFVPKWAEDAEDLFIPFPETATSTFELKEVASARSGLFLIGYDVEPSPKGGVEKSLALYFLSADANLLGLNPGISYGYQTKAANSSTFALPASLYRKLPMPDGDLCSTIGVERASGSLMTDLILTISGYQDGEKGYFYLPLGEEKWQFRKKESNQQEALPPLIIDPKQKFESGLQNCDGFTWDGEHSVLLLGYGKNALQCSMKISVGGEYFPLYLYPKLSQWNLIGFDHVVDTLVIPKKTRKALKWDCGKVVPVQIERTKDSLTISRKSNGKEIFHFRYQGGDSDQSCVIF